MNKFSSREYYCYDREITCHDVEKYSFSNKKIAVIAHTVDNYGRILLQLRGKNADGTNYLYEDISGKFERGDLNYRYAIKREIMEEVGTEANFYIGNSLGIYHNYKNPINYLFVVYFVKYEGGKLKINEPDKCLNYHFFSFEEAINSNMVSESSKFLLKKVRKYNNC